ncbi:MAG: MarR family transcriptional regulator [Planctomycetota bacterium]
MDDKLLNLLGAAALLVHDRLAEAEAAESDAAAIVCIGCHPGESIEEVSRALGRSHSATVRLVDRLVHERLVRRRRSATDRRTATLHLTAAGRRRHERLIERRRSAIGALASELSPRAASDLERSLTALLRAATNTPEAARRTCRLCAESDCRPSGCPVEQGASGGAANGPR